MKETSFLRHFVSSVFFVCNFEEIDSYIKKLLNSPLETLDDSTIKELEKIKGQLVYNSTVMGSKRSLDFSANIELLLFRYKEKDSETYQLISLLLKRNFQEEELIWALNSVGDYRWIIKKLLLKKTDILDCSDNTMHTIRDYLGKDLWYNNFIKEKSVAKATKILNNLDKEELKEEDITLELKSLLRVLEYDNLKTSVTIGIVQMLKNYENKLLQDGNSDISLLVGKIKERLLADTYNRITYKLVNEELDLSLGENFVKPINYLKEELDLLKKTGPVITLDEITSPDLDSAFAITKQDDLFLFDVYVTDVPSFLSVNRNLSINAFKQGSSFYIRDNKVNINYDMLPKNLSHDYLSMTKKTTKKEKAAICFHYIMDKNGNICSLELERKMVVVDFNLFKNDAERILKNKQQLTLVDKSLFYLRNLCKIVGKNSDDKRKNLASLRRGTISDMIAFPSVLVNYSLADKLEFGIYRNEGAFTISKSNILYARGGAPLRRYADDINLAILLEQENLQRFARDDFRYLENNLEEIVDHLNEQDSIEKYIRKNNEIVKKYCLKK